MRERRVQIGLSACLEHPPGPLQSGNFGLVMNQASVDQQLQLSCDVLNDRFPGQLKALFSPQHGLWGEEQANMIESRDGRYTPLDLPIYSLYSKTRRPTADMMRGLDVLVVDLQDVGTRVYTFIWTLLECLHACADAGIPIVVLDRPNPLGGAVAEGPLLCAGFRSFVGNAEIPLRHALTIGELAALFRLEHHIDVELHVVPMQDWQRSLMFPETLLPWVMPSPNMPRFETAVLYPGQVLLEGTNLSEGRGTTAPFEFVGAPYIDGDRLASMLSGQANPGVRVRPVRYRPTFDKWANQICGGVSLHVTEPENVRSVALTLRLLKTVWQLWPDDFSWLDPPYEYEYQKLPIDILFGSDRLRIACEQPATADWNGLADWPEDAWWQRAESALLYPPT